ncbi:HAD family hydrolase [Staphylococcus edaphicus]|uniref:Glucuronate isomerase n=1 Tax=Staphylococcus edaphicus TaxID=1955013 RepID=A0A2C6WLE8_9STAP|nr:HAD hydrolase-like protein [Staphylococcus edaphicus]PHK48963.1 glucuronate isomerase [Staphylococcus edaphicus]UQW81951.1 HAD hydrolase-like protein [Staphylococcus edaphicus]
MISTLSRYQPRFNKLICVDSDGCAIDTMTIKHERAFGPALVAEWQLNEHSKAILQRWNEFNLYEITRGINRFKGLEKMLAELVADGFEIEGYEDIKHWVTTTHAFSNPSLEQAIADAPDQIGLRKALAWSHQVNQRIQELPSIGPFNHVLSTLKNASSFADIAIVSSANLSAVQHEWETYHLTPYLSGMFAQEAGTKEHCLAVLKQFYNLEDIVMLGDAKGDMEAAQVNGIYFYPILAGHEDKSWLDFNNKYLKLFKEGHFDQDIQSSLITAFYNNFEGAK